MRPFEILETSALVNALAEYTSRYTKLHTEGGRERDIVHCKETIDSLIDEIELRKKSSGPGSPAAQAQGRQ